MKCKDVEPIIIEASHELLDGEDKKEMERHLKDCARCARLEEEMDGIKNAFLRHPRPALPEVLDERTHRMCRAELASAKRKADIPGEKNWLKSIPLAVKTAFISLFVLTAVWAVLVFRELRVEDTVSATSILLLALMIQNAVMLVFSPLLLRGLRLKKSKPEMYSLG